MSDNYPIIVINRSFYCESTQKYDSYYNGDKNIARINPEFIFQIFYFYIEIKDISNMTSNYDQLKSKAEQVVSAHEDFRNKTRLLEHTEREYQQALANVARTEAEYTLRKDQSDFFNIRF